MATNARGVWLAMRHEIPAMLAADGGAIVKLSSIAGTILWLCSDAASYVTGAPIAADGGFLAA
jgi:NAD(P)-dependent dehydrogenase (short-subunit alcohol dehydrogenase family)